MTLLPPSFTMGFAVVTPRGAILGHSYRETSAEAIAAVANGAWDRLSADGYTVQLVYARIFIPHYFPTKPETQQPESQSEETP
ncbi:UNVERIFIED_ORG: hypothetical protein LHK14_00390 [Roseateles sp. XES5]|nr:hypothetical protein [Roseateles sp. XES5]